MYERIKELCKKNGITLRELEEQLNFGVKSIGNWQVHQPSIDKVKAVADYFGVSVDFLLGGDLTKEDLLQEAFDARPEMRVLFSLAEKATTEDIEKAIKIIEALTD